MLYQCIVPEDGEGRQLSVWPGQYWMVSLFWPWLLELAGPGLGG